MFFLFFFNVFHETSQNEAVNISAKSCPKEKTGARGDNQDLVLTVTAKNREGK